MSQSFLISATVFTIVMVIFHIIKDIILRGSSISVDSRSRLNIRWLISTAIGYLILFVMYGRGSP